MNKLFKTSGLILLYLVIYYFFQIFYTLGLGFVLGTKHAELFGTDAFEEIINQKVMEHIPISLIFAAFVSVIIYYLICKKRNESFLNVCKFNKMSLKHVAILIPVGISIYFINIFVLNVVHGLGLFADSFAQHEESMGFILGDNLFLTILAVGIVVPIIEEIIFRGLVFSELKKHLSLKVTIVIQAALFGLYHMQLIQGVYTFLFGILLGLVYVWLKSIWAPIILHALLNLSSIIMVEYASPDFFNNYLFISFIISVVVTVSVFTYLYKNKVEAVDSFEEDIVDIVEEDHPDS
ncbi:type II CAAX endopeptidase family protein [Serpentinicella sp. ANB-PHB4]|uniref:CPBP family intramembrane glutamic endopeptidase n=1 Tax=Serpentinicella sp. ANB-PHB4 TaxID=3074076 RepID=UPI0028637B2B|nr:type II CAAX endopeptidase family protein [Serpentinicella sp. ANB-PHB4]MDR5659405.1 type II CAAX endopeptidase family protein [Serpentinicella sp. ANB-PHB4]